MCKTPLTSLRDQNPFFMTGVACKFDDINILGKFGSASVLLKKAPDGTGVIAGGPARAVIEMAGIKNIRTKSLGSNNKQNVVLATIEGLKDVKSPEDVARLRGKSIEEIMG